MTRAFKLLHLLFYAMLVGFMIVVQWSLVPAQNRLSAEAYATLEKGMNNVLETLTPVLMIGALVFGLLVLYLRRRQAARNVLVLLLGGIACLAVMVVSTLSINAPINFAIDAWDIANLPADWMTMRDHWEFGHMIRSYVGLPGLTAALAAVIWDES
ncbi:MAG: DUF1772 domain-containing protein [Phyllobacteriaceae bacterium]|nr:DUF1772 domain-containing protein [Phyllobacteriaceae bacterium]